MSASSRTLPTERTIAGTRSRDRRSAAWSPHRRSLSAILTGLAILGVGVLLLACGLGRTLPRAVSSSPASALGTVNAAQAALPGTVFPSQGNTHINPGEPHPLYNSNPPTSGWHYPTWPKRGIYTLPLPEEYLLHFQEHAGVVVHYNPNTLPADQLQQLTAIVCDELNKGEGLVVMAPDPDIPQPIALTAWQRLEAFSSLTGEQATIENFIERLQCVYDPEGVCGPPHGAQSYPSGTPAPGAPSVVGLPIGSSAVGSTLAIPSPTVAAPPAAPAGIAGAGGSSSAGPVRAYATAPAMTLDPSKQYRATIKTDQGDIVVQLFVKDAPRTVNSFVFLAQHHFYDGLSFDRVVPGFVIQGGDPNGNATGGPGYSLPDEINNHTNDAGALAMANAGPGTDGSTLYINLAPNPALNAHYTVFGQVEAGMDVVQRIGQTAHDPQNSAVPATRIESITISAVP